MVEQLNVAVAGATGLQGGALSRALLRRGHRVTALVRDPQSSAAEALQGLGASIMPGDFDDTASLARAMSGADAAFVMATPFVDGGTATEIRHGTALVDAAAAAGADHIVYSSVASADRRTGVPHFESKNVIEAHLRRSGIPWTVVGPTEFLDMVLAPWSLPSLRQGSIGVPVPGPTPRQLTVVDDLTSVVLLALEQPARFAARRIEIASDTVTGDGLAAALSRATGREVRYAESAPGSAGEDLEAMYAFLRDSGYDVDVTSVHSDLPDIAWHTVDTWLGRQDWTKLLAVGAAV